MPEYLAPGVYVEETSFRAKSIEGVGTSTTAFVGPTRKGPLASATALPELLTSFADFERLYGGLDDLGLGATEPAQGSLNFVAHAARAYFNEGGGRLYVARVVRPRGAADAGTAQTADLRQPAAVPVTVPVTPPAPLPTEAAANRIRFVARMAGQLGNGAAPTVEQPQLRGIQTREIVAPAPQRVLDMAPPGSLARIGTAAAPVYQLKVGTDWFALNAAGVLAAAATANAALAGASLITLAVITTDAGGGGLAYDDMGFDSRHPRWVGRVMTPTPARRVDQVENLYALNLGADVNARQLLDALFPEPAVAPTAAELTTRFANGRRASFALTGGNDGAEPATIDYAGAFDALAALDDISIVAAPGSSAYADAAGIRGALISHAEGRRRYRIAVLDTALGQNPGAARTERAGIDSRHAALYYPWVVISNPNARPGRDDIPREIAVPPSGFICGIYARNDVERGVHKAPANEVVRGALRFEREISTGEQELLNPLGVNCLRFFPGRGYRVWGARTASSDPEWKYVNVRRYFNYLEASIDRGTQWAVFEPNGERLWANVRTTIADYLYNEWVSGALLGAKPEQAFFVRCDRSTMTQNDLDNGRLICLVGVAALKPAEFVIFRIGQKTADARE